MTMRQRSKAQAGLTLVELLVAMAIIGVLGALFSIGMHLLTRWVAPWAGRGAGS